MRSTSAAEQRNQGVSTAVATGLAAFALVAGSTVPPSTNGLSIGHLTMVDGDARHEVGNYGR